MGQQQLLLVILVTIIVGIATVVALNVFGTQADEANRDAVRQDILSAAANAQGFYIRPEMMEGGAYSFDDSSGEELTIEALGIPGSEEGGNWVNENGTYSLDTDGGADNFTITAEPASGTEDIEAFIAVCDGGADDDDEVDIGWDGENPC